LLCNTNPVINLNGTLQASSTIYATKGLANEILIYTTSLTDGTNTATLSSSNIYYTVNGRNINFSSRLFVTATNSLGNAYITLPFASNSAADYNAIINLSSLQNFTPTANTAQIYGFIGSNSNRCYLYTMNASGAQSSITASNIGTNCVLVFTGSYFTQ
jgi:hypothetical protein